MNRDDLGEMIEQQIPRLRRYARALVRDRERADDLVEQCLDQAWRRVHQWHPAQDLRVWLFSIIHNLNTNSAKRLGMSIAMSDGGPTAEGHRQPGALERDSATDPRGLEYGLAQLPQDHRAVLLLVCIEEMSYEQVAAVLGIPVGTVITRLHRSREQLRRWMSGEQRPSLRRVK